MELKQGMAVFFLDSNCWNPNLEDELIKECEVIEENGELIVRSKNYDYLNGISFNLKDCEDWGYLMFATREEAQAEYDRQFEGWKVKKETMDIQQFANMLFHGWQGEHIFHTRELKVMKDMFKKHFGVEPE